MSPRSMNWDGIHTLLSIMNMARQWPDLKHIHDAAYNELRQTEHPEVTSLKANLERANATLDSLMKAHNEETAAHEETKGELEKAHAQIAELTPPDEEEA